MELHIQRWYGRLGNNIKQVYNCILIAIHLQCNIRFPFHDFLNKQYIQFHSNEITEIITDPSYFFFDKCLTKYMDSSSIDSYSQKAKEILRDCFIINPRTIEPLNHNDLVIHIRGGDIFTGDGAHPLYAQPPLSFYTKILKNYTFGKVYMVSEDMKNPCVNALLTLFPHIIFKKNLLMDDVKLILATKNITNSTGTFIPSLITLSIHVKNIYTYTFPTEYKAQMIPWKNTDVQRDCMMTFDFEKDSHCA